MSHGLCIEMITKYILYMHFYYVHCTLYIKYIYAKAILTVFAFNLADTTFTSRQTIFLNSLCISLNETDLIMKSVSRFWSQHMHLNYSKKCKLWNVNIEQVLKKVFICCKGLPSLKMQVTFFMMINIFGLKVFWEKGHLFKFPIFLVGRSYLMV